jgi:glycosyltransferase involved in cell wall biosynthesis
MKIAIVIDVYNDKGNGTSISAQQFVEQLKLRGHEVVILCTEVANSVADSSIVTFQTKKIPFFQSVCESQHAILAEPDDQLIKKAFSGVDIVHIYMPFWLGTHSAKIAYEMGIPVLGCYHIAAENLTFNAGLKHVPFANAIAYDSMRNMHYKTDWIKDIHCPSKCIASTIFKYHYKQSLHIISNGYDSSFKPMKVEKPAELKNKFVITSVGRLTEEKRQDLIIKAIGKSKYKNNIVLFLAGKGPKKEKYEALAEKFNVDLRIVFLSKEEIIKLHNYSDLFVQASDVETESISCLEAIACGVIPIISNAKMCATKQFALDKHSLFKKGKYKKLSNCIDYWLTNKDLSESMHQQYAEFAEKFSLEISVNSILDVYKLMLKRKNTNQYCIKDYNNALSVTVQLNSKGKPAKQYRALLRQFHRLLGKNYNLHK